MPMMLGPSPYLRKKVAFSLGVFTSSGLTVAFCASDCSSSGETEGAACAGCVSYRRARTLSLSGFGGGAEGAGISPRPSRSEERRVGQERVRSCRYGWSQYLLNNKKAKYAVEANNEP